MAKSARKPSTSKAKSPVAVAVAACFGIVYSALTDANAQANENAARGTSRSKQCVDAIGALRKALPDKSAYHDACIELFGNGEKKKDLRVAGSLSEKLKADGVGSLAVKSLLHNVRVVAMNWDNASVQKAASESGIRAAYDATKAPKETNSAGTPKAKDVSLPELIASMIEQLNGPAIVLGMIESALLAKKDTIRSKIVHDARTKMVATA